MCEPVTYVKTPFSLAASVKGQLVGYMLAHGWQRNAPPSLGTPLEEVGSPKILFIHDMAVATTGQGFEIGRRLVDHAFDMAFYDGLRSAGLVAVEDAAGFWKTMSFLTLYVTPQIAAKLAGYERGDKWMGRTIG